MQIGKLLLTTVAASWILKCRRGKIFKQKKLTMKTFDFLHVELAGTTLDTSSK